MSLSIFSFSRGRGGALEGDRDVGGNVYGRNREHGGDRQGVERSARTSGHVDGRGCSFVFRLFSLPRFPRAARFRPDSSSVSDR